MMNFAEFMQKAAEGPPLQLRELPSASVLGSLRPPMTRSSTKAARVAEREKSRSNARRMCHEEKRHFNNRSDVAPSCPYERAARRREQLMEWRLHQKVKKNRTVKSKPPFKVGVVPKDLSLYKEPAQLPSMKSDKRNQTILNSTIKSFASFAPLNAQFKAPTIRKRGEISKEEPYSITSLSEKFEDACSTAQETDSSVPISPYVTVSRGKSKRPSKDPEEEYEQSPEKTAQHFRLQLDGEIARLQDLCDTWRTYKEHNDLIEDNQDLINLAIGQTQLLINKKFEQFRGLIVRCETKEVINGEGLVTVDDLQGFWDMVYMQVSNIDIKYQNLSKLKDNDWKDVDDAPKIIKPKLVKKANPVKSVKGSSGLKAMILAARLKSQQQDEPTVKTPIKSNQQKDVISFDGGFFAVVSPIKNVSDDKLTTPVRSNIRNSVISSEARKHLPVQTPVNITALLKVSSVAKCVANNVQLSPDIIADVMPIDLNKTPARSILKTPITNSTSKQSNSTVKKNVKILFSQESDLVADEKDCEEDVVFVSPIKSPNSIQKKNFKQPKKRVGKKAPILSDENVSPLLSEPEKSGRRISTRSSSLFKSPMIKILSSPNAIENTEDQDGPLLNESFLEVFGMSLKSTRKSTRQSVARSFNDCRASINLISFDSPVRPAYMTRSVIKKYSNVPNQPE